MTTYTSQPDEASGIDTLLKSTEATTNFATNVEIYVGEANFGTDKYRSLIKFDLSSIPTNAVVSSAILSLWTSHDYSDNARNFSIYRVLVDWVENQATWNIRKTGTNWNTSGCGGVGSDYDGTALATTAFANNISNGTEKQFSLDTTVIEGMINGTYQNYGFLIKADTESNDLYGFHSSSSSTSGYRPKLVIEYTVPSAEGETITQEVFLSDYAVV